MYENNSIIKEVHVYGNKKMAMNLYDVPSIHDLRDTYVNVSNITFKDEDDFPNKERRIDIDESGNEHDQGELDGGWSKEHV